MSKILNTHLGPPLPRPEPVDPAQFKPSRPVLGLVHALPRCESGRALLELRNGSELRVAVTRILAFPEGDGAGMPLSQDLFEMRPGESQIIDITRGLHEFAPRGGIIQIRLDLSPEPPKQPGPGKYRVSFEDDRCTEFSAS